MGQLSLFDYQAIDRSLAASLQERASRIAARESRIVEDILANGREFAEARDELRHNKAGGFEGWVAFHGWTWDTATRYIRVWEKFGNISNLPMLSFDVSALYLLAAPSTPPAARQEALTLAEAGGVVTHARAREIVEAWRPAPADEATTDGPAPGEEGEWDEEDDGAFASPSEPTPPAPVTILPSPPPRYPHSERLKAWLKRVQSETLVIRVELGGIRRVVAEAGKWDRREVVEFILPMLDALAGVIAEFKEEIANAFE